MPERQLIPALPVDMRQQLNIDLMEKSLAVLDDNGRFVVRRMVAQAHAKGFDSGYSAGQDDAHHDHRIERDKAKT